MPKEKSQEALNNQKISIFYYEIIGIICVIISIIAILKFGIMGKYIAMFFKLLFGDWYFLFIGLFFIYGIRLLLYHTSIKFNDMQIIGVILIMISLIILSHISFYRYINSFEGNNLKVTLIFYFDAFKKLNFQGISGGGIVGGTLFYLCHFLFSDIGTIIIVIIILYVGFSFLFKHTVMDFTNVFIKLFKFGINKINKFRKMLKYNVNASNNSFCISKKWFKNNNYYFEKNQFKNDLLIDNLKKIINDYNFFYNELLIYQANHIFLFNIKCYLIKNFNIDDFYKYLKKNINNSFLFRYYTINNGEYNLFIEVKNPNYRNVSFNEASTNFNSNLNLILGMLPNSQYLYYNLHHNIIIFESFNSNYLITIYYLLKFNKKITIMYYDQNENDLFYDERITDLNEILSLITKRINIFSENYVNTIDEYNSKNFIAKLKYIYIFIPDLANIIEKNCELFEEILVASVNVGIYFICNLTKDLKISHIFDRYLEIKIIKKSYFNNIKEYVQDIVINEMSYIEGYYIFNQENYRISLSMITDDEIKIIKNYNYQKK